MRGVVLRVSWLPSDMLETEGSGRPDHSGKHILQSTKQLSSSDEINKRIAHRMQRIKSLSLVLALKPVERAALPVDEAKGAVFFGVKHPTLVVTVTYSLLTVTIFVLSSAFLIRKKHGKMNE